MQDAKKKTLVLDLDETLVHSSFKPIPDPDYIIPVEIEGKVKAHHMNTSAAHSRFPCARTLHGGISARVCCEVYYTGGWLWDGRGRLGVA